MTPAADLQSSRPEFLFQNPGRDDHSRDAGRHDCQLKQVILWSYMDTGPTSQRQYAAFFKLIALQYLDFICKSRNQLLLIVTLQILWNNNLFYHKHKWNFYPDDLMGKKNLLGI